MFCQGKELKKELKLSDAIHDLPKGNALRESLQKFIDQLHKKLDELPS